MIDIRATEQNLVSFCINVHVYADMYMHMYMYMYMYMQICICRYVYVYVYDRRGPSESNQRVARRSDLVAFTTTTTRDESHTRPAAAAELAARARAPRDGRRGEMRVGMGYGMEWNGVEWSGVEWSGMEWNGVEWSVV